MSLHLWEGGHIDFIVDPIGVGVGVTLSCLDNILYLRYFFPDTVTYFVGFSAFPDRRHEQSEIDFFIKSNDGDMSSRKDT